MEDVVVIGAGIFGLSIARKLQKAGRDVRIFEATHVGAGSSATPLGVLSPHAPDNWNEKKEAQFQALRSLPAYLDTLEQETGLSVGYRRCGRLLPLTTENQRAIWTRRVDDAHENWQGEATLEIVEPPQDWLSPEMARFGAVYCGLSARIDARAYLSALAAAVGEARIHTGKTLERLEPQTAFFSDGSQISARRIIITTGTDAFRYLPDTDNGEPAGRGEKGQAALFRLAQSHGDDRPIVFFDGTYVVPRGNGIVALGATSERRFDAPNSTDALLDAKIDKARALCPALEGAEEIERWAALRPRAADRRLLVAPHPTLQGVTIATGGFKTGLAMAHMLAV